MGEEQDQFADTREGSAKWWISEFEEARKELKPWHESAEECDAQYRDDKDRQDQRLNLYAAGIDLKEATLYGNTPSVDVKRRNNDQEDDDARVAGELLERLLNGDLERDEEAFPRAIGLALKDWLLADCGLIWERLEFKTQTIPAKAAILGPDGQEQAPAVPETTQTVPSEVATDYVFWKDLLWSPARVFDDVRWVARKALMSKKSIEAKFGKEDVPLAIGADPKDKTVPKTPWARAEVWEILDKENKCIWWCVEGHSRVLVPVDAKANPNGSVPDPLGLSTFWPFPEPLITGATTSQLVPRPSYARAQDLYKGIDDTYTREKLLRDAIDASGIYDATVGELAEVLNSRGENKMVPAANYKALAEKGGIAACAMWKPIEVFVAAIAALREGRREDIELLFQVDGTSDIMRGQASAPGTTATEQAIKAKYGSIRGDKAQKRFAKFCSDAQRIRGEIICKHFPPEMIAQRANADALPESDKLRVPNALGILKDQFSCYRIVVKAETVSLTDYAANKQESMDVLGTIATVQKMMQGVPPQLVVGILKLAQVALSRVKGGDAYEAVIDEMIEQAEQMVQQAQQAQAQQASQPNPQMQVEQVKAQAEMGAAQAKMQQTGMEMQKSQIEHQNNMEKLKAEVRADAMKAAMEPKKPGESE